MATWTAIRNQVVVQVASVVAGTPRVSPPLDPNAGVNAGVAFRSPTVVQGVVTSVGPQAVGGLLVNDIVYFLPQYGTVLDDLHVLVLDSQIEACFR
jgi:hypothetical protein